MKFVYIMQFTVYKRQITNRKRQSKMNEIKQNKVKQLIACHTVVLIVEQSPI